MRWETDQQSYRTKEEDMIQGKTYMIYKVKVSYQYIAPCSRNKHIEILGVLTPTHLFVVKVEYFIHYNTLSILNYTKVCHVVTE